MTILHGEPQRAASQDFFFPSPTLHPIADHFEKRIRQQGSNPAWENAFPKPVPPLPTGLSSPLQSALDKKNNSASQPGVSYSGNTQQSPDSLISFTGLGWAGGGGVKFF